LAAQDPGERLAAAGIADVVDAPRLDADGGRNEAREDLVAAADRAAAPRDRFGVALECGEQVVEGAKRRCDRNGERFILAREPCNRHGVGESDR
jgi:hypothetical protein